MYCDIFSPCLYKTPIVPFLCIIVSVLMVYIIVLYKTDIFMQLYVHAFRANPLNKSRTFVSMSFN